MQDHPNSEEQKKFITNQGSNFVGGSFSNRNNAKASIQLRKEKYLFMITTTKPL